MIISVASGKGGTGKTTVAVNLAKVQERDILLADCDVEEPNCHLFLKPEIAKETGAQVMVPRIDEEKCTLCGECARACRFNALLVTKKNVLVFDELCHGCGTCTIVCPEDAILETKRLIGVIKEGSAGEIDYIAGVLNVGEPMAPPLIKEVKQRLNGNHELTILDASPGTSCPVIEAVRGSDLVVLVTEPTPFGLSDLKLAVGMTRSLKLPIGVVINRYQGEGGELMEYLEGEKIKLLAKIPLSRSIAETISRGDILVEDDPEMKRLFKGLLDTILSYKGGT